MPTVAIRLHYKHSSACRLLLQVVLRALLVQPTCIVISDHTGLQLLLRVYRHVYEGLQGALFAARKCDTVLAAVSHRLAQRLTSY
jgi:hypothetical protein